LVLDAIPAGCKRAVDVGCGNGGLTRALRGRGVPELVGIDRDEPCIERCKSHPGLVTSVTSLVTCSPARWRRAAESAWDTEPGRIAGPRRWAAWQTPNHSAPRGHQDLEPTEQPPLMAGCIAHLRTSPASPGAAGCPALTGRRLRDRRAARRTRDLCRRDSRLRSAMDLACTCDRPRVYLAGDPGTTVSTHRGPSRRRTTPDVSRAASAAIPLPAPFRQMSRCV
jgi:hypothetical protein